MSMSTLARSSWTDEQWQAITTTGKHILVSAAAGSGKTAVLVERFIYKITNPNKKTSVDRLLVATYTKAAAAEMKHRIREALERMVQEDPKNEHIQRQLYLLDRALITTIHSFCMDVIRQHSHLVPLSASFRVLQEHESQNMRQEVLDACLEEHYGGAVPDEFHRLVDWFTDDRTDNGIGIVIQKLYDFCRSHPWPHHWLAKQINVFSEVTVDKLSHFPFVKNVIEDARMILCSVIDLLQQALQIVHFPDGPSRYTSTLYQDITLVHQLQQVLSDQTWEQLYMSFQQIAFSRLPPCRGDEADPAMIQRVKQLRQTAKQKVIDLKKLLFDRAPQTLVNEMRSAAPLMKKLVEIVIQFDLRYEQYKQQKCAVDFHDLEHYCLRILRHPQSTPDHSFPSEAAIQYGHQFDEVMLDEYQDTNEVQDSIVQLLLSQSSGHVFMVGDVKQSIYRFRLAEPALFLRKYDLYKTEQQKAGTTIQLTRNFRSRIEIVTAVNMLFRQIMNEQVAQISYDERAQLVCGTVFPPLHGIEADLYLPELVLIDQSHPVQEQEEQVETIAPSDEDQAEQLKATQLETRVISRRIKQLMHAKQNPLLVYDQTLRAMRRVQYSDIVILLRSASNVLPLMIEELSKQGIPVVGEQHKGFFNANEIQTMVCLLQIIDNPQQDIPLAAVLRSPIVGLKEEELAYIRVLQREGPFYEAVSKVANATFTCTDVHEQHDQLTQKLRHFWVQVQQWRQQVQQGMSVSQLIKLLYKQTGYLDWTGGLSTGRQRQQNLHTFYERARQYEQTSGKFHLLGFITMISRLRDNGKDLTTTTSSHQGEDAVQIMTIHRSKGLEFPIVFIAGINQRFYDQDLHASFLMHKQFGFGPHHVNLANQVVTPTISHICIRRQLQKELLAEEMRILYVALTRATQKMILVGTVRHLIRQTVAWSTAIHDGQPQLPNHMLSAAKSYLDWIGPSLMRHPSGHVLRAMSAVVTSLNSSFANDGTCWSLSIIDATRLQQKEHESVKIEPTLLNDRNDQYLSLLNGTPVQVHTLDSTAQIAKKELQAVLEWKYPYQLASQLKANATVTELREKQIGQNEWVSPDNVHTPNNKLLSLYRPAFMGQHRLTATEKGTVYHIVMQHIPLDRFINTDIVNNTLEHLINKCILRTYQTQVIQPRDIVSFFESKLGKMLLAAEWVKREVPFTYQLPARYMNEHAGEEKVLMQGVIDVLFFAHDQLFLLDYKTDKVTDHLKALGILQQKYEFQLNLYAQAIEQIIDRKIDQKWLYFFDGQEAVQVT